MEVRLYHAISGQGIEQLGALFGSVFPLFLVKLAWGGVEFPAFGLAVGVGRGGGVGNSLPLALVAVLQVTVTSICY